MIVGIDPGTIGNAAVVLTFPLSDAPSMNVIMRENYHKKRKRKDDIKWRILGQRPSRFKGRVDLKVTRYTTQLMDWDNACASVKFIMDSLVDLGIIEDDSPNIVQSFTPLQVRVGKRKECKIEIQISYTPRNE